MTTSARERVRRTSIRLFLTVWIGFSIFTTTNVARETYLAIAMGGYGTLRVDRYVGLHPDLFVIPGRGAYINNNPGASMLGAAAYYAVHPAIELVVSLRPSIAAPKPPARYLDPRPNRTKFMNASRARGLDIVLGLAAIGIALLLMAPLAGAATVVMYRTLSSRLGDETAAARWAVAYAFATPILFRSAFLNQNAILAHCVLGAWVALSGFDGAGPAAVPDMARWRGRARFFAAGALSGFGVLCDYSGIPFLVVLTIWILVETARSHGISGAFRAIAPFFAGAAIPLAMLLLYQWAAFGHPLHPAQSYMPPTEFSVRGWNGFTLPTTELLWGNLFDARYGLIAFCPLLAAAFAAPLVRPGGGRPSGRELLWIFAAVAGLYVFSSANQFANLQWNTGVRYMVPAVPLLFIAAVPVLRRLPSLATAAIVAVSLVISLAVSMTREDVATAARMILHEGPTLPVLIVLRKMESGYPGLSLPWFTAWIVFAVTGIVLWMTWAGWPRLMRRTGYLR